MKGKHIFMLKVLIMVFSTTLEAQSIRKDYREFTNQEMIDYRAALQALRANGTWNVLADHHEHHFMTPIHTAGGQTGELFLPWHRFFLLDIESRIKSTSSTASYLSLPYWDWRTDNSTGANWHTSFLSSANLPGFTFTRSIGGSGFLGSTSNIQTCLGLTAFWNTATTSNASSADFSHRLEYYHNNVHVWVGGTMGERNSPADPIFYLHHNAIDKFWQDWEDQQSSLQSTFPSGASANMPGYISPPYPFNVYANDMKDSRRLTSPLSSSVKSRRSDVWFAYNRKVLIDGSNGTSFVCNDASTPYVYRYTAATTPGGSAITGAMYIGDIQRDANNNVITDTKGGVSIASGARVSFLAGGSVTFMPGFNSDKGAVVNANTITTASGARVEQEAELEVLTTVEQPDDLFVYPNPVDGNGRLNMNKVVNTYKLVNAAGLRVLEGSHSDQIQVDDLPKGLYLLHADGNTLKVVIQ